MVSASALAIVLLAGCATNPPPVAPAGANASVPRSRSDAERLRQIAAQRSELKPAATYLIGAGDLLEVNVFDLAEMNRKVRVGASGFIQLPLIGAVKAAGRSEAQLAEEISGRLSKDYLQNPQVDVFVEEYKSQQVAVTGSVAKPGLYPLTRERYTILDILSEAGGLNKEAGGVIQFIPAQSGGSSAAFDVASAGGRIPLASESAGRTQAGADAISIDLNDLLGGGNRTALNVTVAAGDVIYVAEAGSFTIEGWVDKPGTYPLTAKTTVLAALSAGGGPLFPSRLGRVEILRSGNGNQGSREIQVVDLNAVRSAESPDVTLRSGDIVRVPAWKILLPPWGVYTFVKSLVSVGASIPIL
jgi:polysaccharide export outer membrane protein